MKRTILIGFVFFFMQACTSEKQVEEIMPSWNETPLKAEIISFVKNVTNQNNAAFVPQKNRIAVFDNDGTLWNEKPLYIPVEYEIFFIKDQVQKHPELKENKLYKALYEDDLAVMHEYSTFELINELFAAHSGQNEEDYKQQVYQFLSDRKHPKYQRPFKEMVYQPMVELVHYLQKNEFKVYIVTGGEISFVRTVSEEIYNIPVENVVGSNVKYKYKANGEDIGIYRTGEIVSANDKHVKPANIELHIGKKPIFAAGNSNGDYEMMQYTLSGNGPSMAILVHHDDSVREYSYTKGTEKAIAHADSIGWKVVSMKNEFAKVFPD